MARLTLHFHKYRVLEPCPPWLDLHCTFIHTQCLNPTLPTMARLTLHFHTYTVLEPCPPWLDLHCTFIHTQCLNPTLPTMARLTLHFHTYTVLEKHVTMCVVINTPHRMYHKRLTRENRRSLCSASKHSLTIFHWTVLHRRFNTAYGIHKCDKYTQLMSIDCYCKKCISYTWIRFYENTEIDHLEMTLSVSKIDQKHQSVM